MFRRAPSCVASLVRNKFYSQNTPSVKHFSTEEAPKQSQKLAAAQAAKAAAESSRPAQAPKKTAKHEDPPAGRLIFASLAALLLSGGAIIAGAQYQKVTPQEFVVSNLKLVNNTAEELLWDVKEAIYQKFSSKEPLLPDDTAQFEKMNLPCIIIEFDRVLVRWVHTTRHGWKCVWRPGAYKMLQELSTMCEVYIWSDDAMGIVEEGYTSNELTPIVDVIYSDQIRTFKGKHVKDLTRLGRPLRRVIHIDHDAEHMFMQPENGILIREYDGSPDDNEIPMLSAALKDMIVKGMQEQKDYRDLISAMGGGDVDFARRHMLERKSREERFQRMKTAGKRFSLSGSGGGSKGFLG